MIFTACEIWSGLLRETKVTTHTIYFFSEQVNISQKNHAKRINEREKKVLCQHVLLTKHIFGILFSSWETGGQVIGKWVTSKHTPLWGGYTPPNIAKQSPLFEFCSKNNSEKFKSATSSPPIVKMLTWHSLASTTTSCVHVYLQNIDVSNK